MVVEAARRVELDRGLVRLVDVDRRNCRLALAQTPERARQQEPAEAAPLVLRRRADDVDLADAAVGRALLDLQPAEPRECTIDFEHQHVIGPKPWLFHAGAQVIKRPAPVLPVSGEDAVVQLQPRFVVDAGPHRPERRAGQSRRRRGAAHVAVKVEEPACRRESELGGHLLAGGRVVVGPEVELARALAVRGHDRVREQHPAHAPAPERRIDHQLAGRAALVLVAVCDRVRVPGQLTVLEREDRHREVIAALEAQELVLAQRFVPIGARGGIEQPRKALQMLGFELRDDFYMVHIRDYPGEYRHEASRRDSSAPHCICNCLQRATIARRGTPSGRHSGGSLRGRGGGFASLH